MSGRRGSRLLEHCRCGSIDRRTARGASRARRGRSACTSAARPSTSASTSGTRGRSCSRCGCGAGCARAGTRSRSSTTSPTSTTRSTRRRRGPARALAAEATRWFVEDTSLLGLGRPDVEPSASETMPEIVGAISELVSRGFAYEAEGDVYFRVARGSDYGQLSRQRPDQVEEQEPNPRKEDPRDFALWKAQKPHEDTAWESPWGPGRPGWHIECSAMAEKHLGPEFEIHGGGLDLRLSPPRERAGAVACPGATRSRGSGCTTGCSSSATRRCRSRSGTSSRCGTCSNAGGPRRCCSST